MQSAASSGCRRIAACTFEGPQVCRSADALAACASYSPGMGLQGRAWAPAALDVAVAGLLTVIGVVGGFSATDYPRPGVVTALLMGVAGAVLGVRRRWPLTSFAVAVAALGAVALCFGHYESGASVLVAIVATYSAVVHGGDLRFVAAVLIAYTAVLNLGQPLPEAVADMVFTVTALGLVAAAGLAVATWRRHATASQRAVEVLAEQQEEAAREAVEAERRRIARELHDILAHSLSVVALQAGAAERALDRDLERARAAVRATRATAAEAQREVQTLVRVAHDGEHDRAPQPTLTELPDLVDTIRAAGVAVQLVTDGQPQPVPAAVQASLYRVAQEGLTNVLKHAAGSHACLTLRYRTDEVELEVANHTTAPQSGPGSRLGLAGVRERVRLFDGRVHAGPRPDGGWVLRATFPLR
jgi:signal transduction histidine kinase